MATFWKKAAHSVKRTISLYYVYLLFWLFPILCFGRGPLVMIVIEEQLLFNVKRMCTKYWLTTPRRPAQEQCG